MALLASLVILVSNTLFIPRTEIVTTSYSQNVLTMTIIGFRHFYEVPVRVSYLHMHVKRDDLLLSCHVTMKVSFKLYHLSKQNSIYSIIHKFIYFKIPPNDICTCFY